MTITDQTLKTEYLEKHLPYRINSMLAHDLILHRKNDPHFDAIRDRCYGDSTVVEPIFEISLIFARCLLNFLGLTWDKASNTIVRFNPKADDLTILSLFPEKEFCPLDDQIILDNTEGFCTIIRLANKSVAHLTSVIGETQPNEHDILLQTRKAIYQLVIKCVPEIKKQNIWWYTQVQN